MKRWINKILVFLVVITFFSSSYKVLAAEAVDGMTETGTLQELEDGALNMAVATNEVDSWPSGPQTHGRSAIIMDADTGAILYEKNMDEPAFPASITKVLTALIALENSELDDLITVSEECVNSIPAGYTQIGLKPGNIITMEQGLLATLLASANEAAYSVGESVGINAGHDYQWFVEEMNRRSQELGATNSNFVNTNGLHDDNHYTTAKDMALIGRELCKYPEYFTMTQTLEYQIPATTTCEEHGVWQGDMMLWPTATDYYEPVIAGKTGYTDSARSTLFTVADDGNLRLICVVLHTYGAKSYSDTRSLLEYGFANFEKVSLDDESQVVLPKGSDSTQVRTKEVVNQDGDASLNYIYNGQVVGTKALSSPSATEDPQIEGVAAKPLEQEVNEPVAGGFLSQYRWPVVAGLGAVLVVLILIIRGIYLERRRKLSRRRRRH